MGTRHPDHRRAKVHRTYAVEELARLFGVHKNTVRRWVKEGLIPIDDGRPMLFKGDRIGAFLKARRASGKQPCGPGRLYCLPCRAPQRPDGEMVDYIPATATAGSLTGLCPACGRWMHRRVSRERIDAIAAGLDVQFPKGESRLSG